MPSGGVRHRLRKRSHGRIGSHRMRGSRQRRKVARAHERANRTEIIAYTMRAAKRHRLDMLQTNMRDTTANRAVENHGPALPLNRPQHTRLSAVADNRPLLARKNGGGPQAAVRRGAGETKTTTLTPMRKGEHHSQHTACRAVAAMKERRGEAVASKRNARHSNRREAPRHVAASAHIKSHHM